VRVIGPRYVLGIIGVYAALAAVCSAQQGAPPADAEKIRAAVKYLSSDALEGRGMGQPGGDLAADYIGKQFASYGLQPGGDNGTFFQSVSMVAVKTLPDTTFQLVPASGDALNLTMLDDFVTNNEAQKELSDIDAQIVFVGYGVTAPEYKWDDYKGQDLKGKVALLFVNEPVSDDPNFFKGKALTYYGRWTYKLEETARRGAIATLIIHRTDLASYPWEVVRNSWGNEKSYLVLDGTPKLQAASWITTDVAKKLVAMSGLDLDKLFQQAQARDFKPIPLDVKLKAHVASRLRPFVSRNVVAMRPGKDDALKNEAVLFTAHYDHLGIDASRKGDNIYNGAIDNATGCGILLEMARMWASAKDAPPRSAIFAAVTAEEQGLLGSEYFGKHPFMPAAKITLDLNFDALAPLGEPQELEVSGAERTTFYPAVEATAKEFGFAIKPDAQPGAGHYYRSDHFSLARVGIPSFSISEGQLFKGHDASWGEAQAKDYVENHYHQPSDEYRADWDFKGLAKMTRFGYVLGWKAASQPTEVQWVPGDEFEAARKAKVVLYGPLFDNLPQLHVVKYQPIGYPPLARQTRIAGTLTFNVVVASDGSVSKVELISGHPLLVDAAKQAILKWKFQPLGNSEVEFRLECNFAFSEIVSERAFSRTFALEPQKLRIEVSTPPIEPTTASIKR
jgi:TonB family protein